MARLRSREEAEDAVQNVFLRVHMALQRGVVPEYEAAWLYKIAHNVCLTRGESAARRSLHETPQPLDEEEYAVAAPEVSNDELAGLSQALHAMPANQRQAILLREWQGLSYAEIAAAMGLTVPAVETLLFRSRRTLAAALEGAPAPRRRLAARLLELFGLRSIFLRLRALLAGAAPAKLAAGAALVALGGGGLGAAVAVSDASSSQPARVPAVPAVAPPVFAAAPVAAAHQAARTRPAAVARHHVEPSAGVVRPPVVAPSAPSFAPAAAAPSAAAPTPAAEPSPVPRVVPQAPVVSTPSVTVPKVTPPVVSVPAATVPAVSVPTVSLPVSLPPVAVPGVVTLP